MGHSQAFFARVGAHKRYLDTISFIAENDEDGSSDALKPRVVVNQPSVMATAVAFGFKASTVAADVVAYRKNTEAR